MIKTANYNLSLTREEIRQLIAIKPWHGNNWDEPPNANIAVIKNKIRQQLEACQTHCSYCGLRLRGTSKGEIEHIAAKASFRYPQFTFTLKNLTLSCNWCNRPEKKGNKATIAQLHTTYSKCDFLLVHPYFDNPDLHYEWTDNHIEILIQVRNNSAKGLFSINTFELDSPEMNEHRAAQVRYDELKAKYPLAVADEELIEETLDFKP